jgi:hypothetical protein
MSWRFVWSFAGACDDVEYADAASLLEAPRPKASASVGGCT